MVASSPNPFSRTLRLPEGNYDVVGSIVLYKTEAQEFHRAVSQFLATPLKVHLCVIDNSPTPLQELPYDQSQVSYHFSGRNLGYGRAHNLALRAAAGRTAYSAVMNTDIRYTFNAIPALLAFMEKNPQAGMAAPKILYPDGSLQYVCRLLPTPTNLFLRRFFPRARWTQRSDARYELRAWDHECVANIPYFQGSFMFLRTDLCNAIGGFDERFFLYGEDIDLTRRIYKIAQTLYVPDVHITHDYRRYSSRSPVGTWYGLQNNIRYFNKWGWIFDSERSAINRRVTVDLGIASRHPLNSASK